MVLPLAPMAGLLPQLLKKMNQPQPMAPPPPGMQMPPRGHVAGGTMGLPPTPFPEPGIDPRGTGTGGRPLASGGDIDLPTVGPGQQPHTPVPQTC